MLRQPEIASCAANYFLRADQLNERSKNDLVIFHGLLTIAADTDNINS